MNGVKYAQGIDDAPNKEQIGVGYIVAGPIGPGVENIVSPIGCRMIEIPEYEERNRDTDNDQKPEHALPTPAQEQGIDLRLEQITYNNHRRSRNNQFVDVPRDL